MKLLRCTATFGCLAGESLTFGPGLTLLGAPNGGGKSTWCAFLRTMLYGLDTRQRDRKGVPADKNRYRPWRLFSLLSISPRLNHCKILQHLFSCAPTVHM